MTDTNATSQPTRILVATDFSSVSDAALVSASGMAKHYGARLGVSHVAPGVGAIHPAFPSLAKREIVELGEIERRATEAVLSHTKQVIGLGEKDLDVLVAATTGRNEAETISEQAKDYKADLVVVGSHGRTGLSRAGLGSVAEKVVRSAPCDVLVARPVKDKSGPVLASVDLFSLWTLALLILGYRTIARVDTRRAAAVVASAWAILVLVSFGFAFLGPETP